MLSRQFPVNQTVDELKVIHAMQNIKENHETSWIGTCEKFSNLAEKHPTQAHNVFQELIGLYGDQKKELNTRLLDINYSILQDTVLSFFKKHYASIKTQENGKEQVISILSGVLNQDSRKQANAVLAETLATFVEEYNQDTKTDEITEIAFKILQNDNSFLAEFHQKLKENNPYLNINKDWMDKAREQMFKNARNPLLANAQTISALSIFNSTLHKEQFQETIKTLTPKNCEILYDTITPQRYNHRPPFTPKPLIRALANNGSAKAAYREINTRPQNAAELLNAVENAFSTFKKYTQSEKGKAALPGIQKGIKELYDLLLQPLGVFQEHKNGTIYYDEAQGEIYKKTAEIFDNNRETCNTEQGEVRAYICQIFAHAQDEMALQNQERDIKKRQEVLEAKKPQLFHESDNPSRGLA